MTACGFCKAKITTSRRTTLRTINDSIWSCHLPRGTVRTIGRHPVALSGCPVKLHAMSLPMHATQVPLREGGTQESANGDARFLAQRAPHWNVTVLVPSELAIMLEVIGCEPFLRQYALAVCDACTSSWSVRYV